jgi:hypothetical protein
LKITPKQFEENADQDGKGGGSDSSGSDGSSDDDGGGGGWDFESRKFTAEELKAAMKKEQTLADELKYGTSTEEWKKVEEAVSQVAEATGAATLLPLQPLLPVAPCSSSPQLLPLPALLPLPTAGVSSSSSSLSSSSSSFSSSSSSSLHPLGVNFSDAVIQPSMDGLLSTINQDSLHFGDVTAALSHLRSAFEQLNACGEHQGQLTSDLMSRIFSEAQRSPYDHIRTMYERPLLGGSAGGGGGGGEKSSQGRMLEEAAAAEKVAKALLARLT